MSFCFFFSIVVCFLIATRFRRGAYQLSIEFRGVVSKGISSKPIASRSRRNGLFAMRLNEIIVHRLLSSYTVLSRGFNFFPCITVWKYYEIKMLKKKNAIRISLLGHDDVVHPYQRLSPRPSPPRKIIILIQTARRWHARDTTSEMKIISRKNIKHPTRTTAVR